MYLGVRGDKLCRVDEIARAYGISASHVGKIVHAMGQKGYLRVQRGRHGGITLGKAPGTINLAKVVRDFEPDLDLVECFDILTDSCAITPACNLKGILAKALKAFEAVLAGYSLADLLAGRKKQRLEELLGGDLTV